MAHLLMSESSLYANEYKEQVDFSGMQVYMPTSKFGVILHAPTAPAWLIGFLPALVEQWGK